LATTVLQRLLLLTGPQKSAHCPEHGGAHYGEARFQQKSLGRTFDRPDKGGAHYREVPTYRGFTVHDIVLSTVLRIMIIKTVFEQYLFCNRDLFIELLSTNLKKIRFYH
jgi:hypothetical protein